MDRSKLLALALTGLLGTGWARGQVPGGSAIDPVWFQGQPPDPTKPTPPAATPPTPTPPASPTADATRSARLNLASRANWKAPMMGDFPGYYSYGTLTSVTTLSLQVRDPDMQPGSFTLTSTDQVRVASPLFTRAGVKVAENESPIPQDRVFATYSNYYRMAVPVVGQANTITTQNGNVVPPGSFGFPQSFNDILVSPVNGNLLITGIEKTVLDGRASVGVRVPFYFNSQSFSSTPNPAALNSIAGPGNVTGQVVGISDGLGGSAIGDMSFLFKYALFRNEETGNLLTTGLAVTVPTGRVTAPPDAALPDDVLLQPFVGYVLALDRFYVHAFHSVLVPTNSADVTLLANDVGFGYRLVERETARGTFALIPTIEAHVTTPLTHRDGTGAFFANDMVVLTGGSHFVIGPGVLTLGVATPVTGPRPFQVESQVRLNWYY